jgi:hypothetical protein
MSSSDYALNQRLPSVAGKCGLSGQLGVEDEIETCDVPAPFIPIEFARRRNNIFRCFPHFGK